ATRRVLVLEGAVDHVGDGLEAAVRVPCGATGLTGRVLDLAHLVHVHERVEQVVGNAGEGAAHGEPLALVAGGGGGDRHDLALGRGLGIWLGDDRQRERVVDGDGGHRVYLRGPPVPNKLYAQLFRRLRAVERGAVSSVTAAGLAHEAADAEDEQRCPR